MSSPPDPAAPDPAAASPPGSLPPATAEIRSGSPFAVDPPPNSRAAPAGDLREASVAAEMARGGILASWLMVPFALSSAWGFPLGGILISALGSLLSLFGCAAPRPRWAIAALLLHITLLVLAALRWLEGGP